jgi:hypothetical protein
MDAEEKRSKRRKKENTKKMKNRKKYGVSKFFSNSGLNEFDL